MLPDIVRSVGQRSDGQPSPLDVVDLLRLAWVGLASVVLLNSALFFLDERIDPADPSVPHTWPISIFEFRLPPLPTWQTLLLVAASTAVFALGTRYVLDDRGRHGALPVAVVGILLVVLTNALQGFEPGFVKPLAGPMQYYRQALQVTDPVAFVRTFEANQLELVLHARTHPPGAVLLFYATHRLFGSPAVTSVVVAAASVVLSSAFLFRLLATYFERESSQFVTYLFVLLPAIQVYYLATLDAVIATAILGALYCFTREDRRIATAGTFACLLVASSLTFMTAFVLPVLAGLAAIDRDRRAPLAAVLGLLVAAYALLYAVLGFDYVGSFLLATAHENEGSFLLFAAPFEYVATRLECVVEVGLFFTPFLLVLWAEGIVGLARGASRELLAIAGLAVLSFLGLLAAGVYHTGETGRGAMYLYPFLLVPVTASLKRTWPERRNRALLAAAVFGQALLMQVVGYYWW